MSFCKLKFYIDQYYTILVNRTNQSTVIKAAINSLLDKGVTDKQDIYTKVVDELGVPRPTVRRVARDLRNELLEKIQILQSETKTSTATVEATAEQIIPLFILYVRKSTINVIFCIFSSLNNGICKKPSCNTCFRHMGSCLTGLYFPLVDFAPSLYFIFTMAVPIMWFMVFIIWIAQKAADSNHGVSHSHDEKKAMN